MLRSSHARRMSHQATRTVTLCIAACAGLSLVAFAQSTACHSGMQMKALPAPESLPVPVKMTGIGNSHLAITATPEAQAWFNQGLNLLHDFWDYESERAFQQGVRVDPNCAMCYWGLYQALMFRNGIPNAYTKQALANAVRLKSQVSKHEQLYIDAASASDDAVNAADPDDDPDTAKQIAIWRQIVKDYPDDLQAKLFLAGALRDGYDDNGEPRKKQKEQIALIQQVLKVAPMIPLRTTTGFTLSRRAPIRSRR